MQEFLFWWQHLPEHISPVILQIGSFKLQYYGLMYLVAFSISFLLAAYRIKAERRFAISLAQLQDLTLYLVVGLVLGARFGYVLIYNFGYYARHPLEIILPFSLSGGFHFTGIAGMSYHGGLIGCVLAALFFVRRSGIAFREIVELYIPVIPLGYTFGRLGNFINGELYGRVTTSPVGMYFPLAPGDQRRHPSQLYEALFEGVLLFVVLWLLRNKPHPRGAMLAFYLIGYGTVRFFIEYFRQPDVQLGFVWLSFSMGQILCALMILGGLLLYAFLRRASNR